MIGEPGLDRPEQLDAKDVIKHGRWDCALNSRICVVRSPCIEKYSPRPKPLEKSNVKSQKLNVSFPSVIHILKPGNMVTA